MGRKILLARNERMPLPYKKIIHFIQFPLALTEVISSARDRYISMKVHKVTGYKENSLMLLIFTILLSKAIVFRRYINWWKKKPMNISYNFQSFIKFLDSIAQIFNVNCTFKLQYYGRTLNICITFFLQV